MQTLFTAGTGGYQSYRIPTLLALAGGRVIAFAEGRRNSVSDKGDIDVVARISEDGGATFSAPFLVASCGHDTIGNPSAVEDVTTGRIFLFMNGNDATRGEDMILRGEAPRTVLMSCSDDGGNHWTPPLDLTAALKLPGWTWYAFGPCHGICMRTGRLVIPANHAMLTAPGQSGPYISHVIYSDDHGKSWHIGGDVCENTNECSVCETADGRLYLNARSYQGLARRTSAWSENGGETWVDAAPDMALPEPVCQGSVLSLPDGRVFFVNPADEHVRRNLTLREKTVDGWRVTAVICPGAAAYADLCRLPDGRLGCLFERCSGDAYERIDFTAIQV